LDFERPIYKYDAPTVLVAALRDLIGDARSSVSFFSLALSRPVLHCHNQDK
jgi:hypothetical protein